MMSGGLSCAMNISSLNAKMIASPEGLPDIQAHHRLGQGSALWREFPRNRTLPLSLHSHVQSRIMLPFGIVSSTPEACKCDVDYRRVATSAIFIGNWRIASRGTKSFGDHQAHPFVSCISLPSIPTAPDRPSSLPHTASLHSFSWWTTATGFCVAWALKCC